MMTLSNDYTGAEEMLSWDWDKIIETSKEREGSHEDDTTEEQGSPISEVDEKQWLE
jgi:hypothetical protein